MSKQARKKGKHAEALKILKSPPTNLAVPASGESLFESGWRKKWPIYPKGKKTRAMRFVQKKKSLIITFNELWKTIFICSTLECLLAKEKCIFSLTPVVNIRG